MIVLFLYPFWYSLVMSFSTPANASELGLKIFTWPVSLEAYIKVFRSEVIYIGYINTIFRTVIGTALTLFVTYCGAYALKDKELPFRNTITLFVLFTMFFNGGLIAIYLNIKTLGLMGSRWALILPLTTSAWNLIVARNFMMALPKELEDAALVDGAHPLKMIFYIMLPLSGPILAVLALWTAVLHWNSWFDALLYVSDYSKMVLQLILRRILIEHQEEMMDSMVGSSTQITGETVRAATIIVSIGPIIIMYPFLQKYFVKGILIGSLKG